MKPEIAISLAALALAIDANTKAKKNGVQLGEETTLTGAIDLARDAKKVAESASELAKISAVEYSEDFQVKTVGGQRNLYEADVLHDSTKATGKGKKILRRGIISGKRLIQQSDFAGSNTVFVIRKDFDLGGQTIELPDHTTLYFEGGSLSNGAIKAGDYNTITNPSNGVIFRNVDILHYFDCAGYDAWFQHENDDKVWDNLIRFTTTNLSRDYTLQMSTYGDGTGNIALTSNRRLVRGHTLNIQGNGRTVTIANCYMSETNRYSEIFRYMTESAPKYKKALTIKVSDLRINTTYQDEQVGMRSGVFNMIANPDVPCSTHNLILSNVRITNSYCDSVKAIIYRGCLNSKIDNCYIESGAVEGRNNFPLEFYTQKINSTDDGLNIGNIHEINNSYFIRGNDEKNNNGISLSIVNTMNGDTVVRTNNCVFSSLEGMSFNPDYRFIWEDYGSVTKAIGLSGEGYSNAYIYRKKATIHTVKDRVSYFRGAKLLELVDCFIDFSPVKLGSYIGRVDDVDEIRIRNSKIFTSSFDTPFGIRAKRVELTNTYIDSSSVKETAVASITANEYEVRNNYLNGYDLKVNDHFFSKLNNAPELSVRLLDKDSSGDLKIVDRALYKCPTGVDLFSLVSSLANPSQIEFHVIGYNSQPEDVTSQTSSVSPDASMVRFLFKNSAGEDCHLNVGLDASYEFKRGSNVKNVVYARPVSHGLTHIRFILYASGTYALFSNGRRVNLYGDNTWEVKSLDISEVKIRGAVNRGGKLSDYISKISINYLP